MQLRVEIRLLLAVAFLAPAGCGSVVTYPVEGKVLLNGKALNRGSIVFWPDENQGNTYPNPASGEIAEDGSFSLYTDGKEGAPPGHYKVTVVAQTDLDSRNPEKVKLLVPKKYTRKEETPLSTKVVEYPRNGAYDFDLK